MNTETQNYKIIVAYDGTRYKGWQVQKSTDDTIQGKLQHVLSTLAGKPVEVIGSGRTDAGVHARKRWGACAGAEPPARRAQGTSSGWDHPAVRGR